MMQGPRFYRLDDAGCEGLLAAHQVGRMAFTFRDRVDIVPVHYVYRDRWIYGRLELGAKTDVLSHNPWVAFEVDAVRALFDWESVVVHGRVAFPAEDGPAVDRKRHACAVDMIRSLIPDAFTAQDPTPSRGLVFALPVAEWAGRAARRSEPETDGGSAATSPVGA
jgi:nitroimidazol reductase NimA-like FMN-containing flavoprotein (pyridoxamine 5'-phosphate oxidase superfamily)